MSLHRLETAHALFLALEDLNGAASIASNTKVNSTLMPGQGMAIEKGRAGWDRFSTSMMRLQIIAHPSPTAEKPTCSKIT